MAGGFGVSIDVDIFGQHAALGLQKALDLVQPASIAMFLEVDAHDVILERTKVRFKKEGDDASGRWQDLSEVSGRFRSWAGYDPWHPINVRTGKLRDWLLGEPPEVSIAGVMTGAEYTWPSDKPIDRVTAIKYETAQRGKSDPMTPPRPAVAANINDERRVYAKLVGFLEKGLKAII